MRDSWLLLMSPASGKNFPMARHTGEHINIQVSLQPSTDIGEDLRDFAPFKRGTKEKTYLFQQMEWGPYNSNDMKAWQRQNKLLQGTVYQGGEILGHFYKAIDPKKLTKITDINKRKERLNSVGSECLPLLSSNHLSGMKIECFFWLEKQEIKQEIKLEEASIKQVRLKSGPSAYDTTVPPSPASELPEDTSFPTTKSLTAPHSTLERSIEIKNEHIMGDLKRMMEDYKFKEEKLNEKVKQAERKENDANRILADLAVRIAEYEDNKTKLDKENNLLEIEKCKFNEERASETKRREKSNEDIIEKFKEDLQGKNTEIINLKKKEEELKAYNRQLELEKISLEEVVEKMEKQLNESKGNEIKLEEKNHQLKMKLIEISKVNEPEVEKLGTKSGLSKEVHEILKNKLDEAKKERIANESHASDLFNQEKRRKLTQARSENVNSEGVQFIEPRSCSENSLTYLKKVAMNRIFYEMLTPEEKSYESSPR